MMTGKNQATTLKFSAQGKMRVRRYYKKQSKPTPSGVKKWLAASVELATNLFYFHSGVVCGAKYRLPQSRSAKTYHPTLRPSHAV